MSSFRGSSRAVFVAIGLLLLVASCARGAAATTTRIDPPAALAPGGPNDRLSVGNQDNFTGPPRDGLYRGDRPISIEQFLRESGHADHVEVMARRRRLRWGLAIGGGTAIVAGVLHAYLTPRECVEAGVGTPPPAYGACVNARNAERMPGMGLSLAGLFTLVASSYISDLRPSDRVLRGFAADYNRRRRIPPGNVIDAPAAVRVQPMVSPDGAGLVLSGQF
jgi:hypothetical protein